MRRDLRRGENAVVHSRMCVRYEHDRVAQRQRSADGGVHVEVTLSAADDKRLDVPGLQQRLEFCLVERVGRGLANANVLGLHSEALVELPAFCAVLKRSVGFLVLDE